MNESGHKDKRNKLERVREMAVIGTRQANTKCTKEKYQLANEMKDEVFPADRHYYEIRDKIEEGDKVFGSGLRSVCTKISDEKIDNDNDEYQVCVLNANCI